MWNYPFTSQLNTNQSPHFITSHFLWPFIKNCRKNFSITIRTLWQKHFVYLGFQTQFVSILFTIEKRHYCRHRFGELGDSKTRRELNTKMTLNQWFQYGDIMCVHCCGNGMGKLWKAEGKISFEELLSGSMSPNNKSSINRFHQRSNL